MANTNINIRIDEELKIQLQELMSNLGMDMTTFFILAAKQAIREQALPFQPKLINREYDRNKEYQIAMKNTKYNLEGKAVISQNDEWVNETEWDEIFEQMRKERGI